MRKPQILINKRPFETIYSGSNFIQCLNPIHQTPWNGDVPCVWEPQGQSATVSEMLFSIYVARLFFLISRKRLPSFYSSSFSVFLSHTQEMESIDNKRSQRPSQPKVEHRKKKREKKRDTSSFKYRMFVLLLQVVWAPEIFWDWVSSH